MVNVRFLDFYELVDPGDYVICGRKVTINDIGIPNQTSSTRMSLGLKGAIYIIEVKASFELHD